jgi:hypothetical protein
MVFCVAPFAARTALFLQNKACRPDIAGRADRSYLKVDPATGRKGCPDV